MGLKKVWEDITWKFNKFVYGNFNDGQLSAMGKFMKNLLIRWIPHVLLLWGIWNMVLIDLFKVNGSAVMSPITLWEAGLLYVLTGILFNRKSPTKGGLK